MSSMASYQWVHHSKYVGELWVLKVDEAHRSWQTPLNSEHYITKQLCVPIFDMTPTIKNYYKLLLLMIMFLND